MRWQIFATLLVVAILATVVSAGSRRGRDWSRSGGSRSRSVSCRRRDSRSKPDCERKRRRSSESRSGSISISMPLVKKFKNLVALKKQQQKKPFQQKKWSSEEKFQQKKKSSEEWKQKPKQVQKRSSEDHQYQPYFYSEELMVTVQGREFLNWGYSERNGPKIWPFYFPIGNEQSPIDICTKSNAVGYDRTLRQLNFDYCKVDCWNLENMGRGFYITFDNDDNTLCGGPLDCSKYILHHIELHWGRTKTTGSLHTIDGEGYAAELLLVHYEKTRCGSWEKALRTKDGIAIVSVFVKTCGQENDLFTTVLKKLNFCLKEGDKVKVTGHPIEMSNILPKDYTEYYTYTGSVPYPMLTYIGAVPDVGLYESVIWIILKNHITMSNRQLAGFQNFYPFNIRPTQPLNRRVIRTSFALEMPGKI